MKLLGSISAAFGLTAALLISSAIAQDEKGKDHGGFPKGYKGQKDSDRRDGNFPRRESSHGSGFKDLSDKERAKVREALQKVWSDPEVIAARHNLQKASEEYRETMRNALNNVDPEIQPILQKMMMSPRGPGGSGHGNGPGSRDWGDPNQPGFARLVVKRVSMEIADRMEPELRGPFGEAHKKVVATEDFQAAIKVVEETTDLRKKQEEARKLREIYRKELEKIDPKFKKYFGRFPGGPRPPHGDSRRERQGPPHDGAPKKERPDLES